MVVKVCYGATDQCPASTGDGGGERGGGEDGDIWCRSW